MRQLLQSASCLLAAYCTDLAADTIPVIGVPVPEFVELDQAMTTLMAANGISAGSLSIMKDGITVFHHTYGWKDRQRTMPLRPDAVFRIASVTKAFTAAGIRKLINAGALSLDDRVFSLSTPDAGILEHQAFGTADPRLANVTVDHLLQHTGGWDQSITGDYTRNEIGIAEAMDVPSPAGRDNIVRYVMGQPMQYAPGTTEEYSNFGYMLLGLIIEEVSGQSYYGYIQQNVIAPIGGDAADWLLGRSLAGDQDPREPFYDDPDIDPNVFFPSFSDTPRVESPYGSFDIESRVGQGGLVTSTRLLLKFLNHYQVSGSDLGGPRPSPGSWRRTFYGSLPGTNALARQRGDGINFAVLLNKRGDSSTTYTRSIRDTIDAYFDENAIIWPTRDVSSISPSVPDIEIIRLPAILQFDSEDGRFYQWQHSEDLLDWIDTDIPVIGNGSKLLKNIPIDGAGESGFYRLSIQ